MTNHLLTERFKILAFLILFLALSLKDSPAAENEFRPLDLQLSVAAKGDPVEGRAAFKRLKCNYCHRVLSDAALDQPVASQPAPVLGGLNKEHTPQELADAILSPSHSFAPGFKPNEQGLSRMGETQHSLTVKDFFDIVAYLKTCEELDASWPKEQ